MSDRSWNLNTLKAILTLQKAVEIFCISQGTLHRNIFQMISNVGKDAFKETNSGSFFSMRNISYEFRLLATISLLI